MADEVASRKGYDNGVYAVFSNPIGMDDDQLKNGCSMIIDPFGEIIAECRELGDCFTSASVTPDKLARCRRIQVYNGKKTGALQGYNRQGSYFGTEGCLVAKSGKK